MDRRFWIAVTASLLPLAGCTSGPNEVSTSPPTDPSPVGEFEVLTDTPTRTATPTTVPTHTPTITPPPSLIPSETHTRTLTGTPTATHTHTPSWTPTLSPTPTQPAPAKVVFILACSQYNAPGNDNFNKEGEWLCFRNRGGSVASMTDWLLHDQATAEGRADFRFYFPQFWLPPGGMVRVHTGCGADGATDLWWCWGGSTAIWNNEGDTVYLYDSSGVLIVRSTY